jgi:hypothetical protein
MNTLNQVQFNFLGFFSKKIIPLSILFMLGFLFYGCNEYQNPVSEVSKSENLVLQYSSASSVIGVDESEIIQILNFNIKFNGNNYDSVSNTSTFSYTVSRSDDATGFNYLSFETPACADLVDYSPRESSTMNGANITWTNSIGSNNSRDYSFTYSGNQPTGMVDATIQDSGTGNIVTKKVPGACKGIYTLSGIIYVDENGNQTKDLGEDGIDDVTVYLLEGNNEVSVNESSADGSYSFSVYTGSASKDFSVKLKPESDPVLFENFSPTTNPPEINFTVDNGNVSGLNLGFKAETQKIISDFEQEIIKLRTEDPEFWADELKFSDKGKQSIFTRTRLLGFLVEIENLGLTYSFQFGTDKIAKAQEILTIRNKSTEYEILLAELLAAKLNVVSGNGAVDENGVPIDEFNILILKSGSAAAVSSNPIIGNSLLMNSATTEAAAVTNLSFESDTSLLLSSFNRSGGGGGTVGSN